MTFEIYSYQDFMAEDFPFKIEVRTLAYYNHFVHAHECLQLCYVVKGSCLHWIHGKKAIVVKGDFFSIPPFLEHRITPRDHMDFEIIQIDFMPFFINENMHTLSQMDNIVDFAYIQPLVADGEDPLPKLNFSPSIQKQVEALIDSMLYELQNKEEGYKLSVKADLLKLLVITGREFHSYRQGNKDHNTISRYRQAFYKAIAYIEQHYAEDMRLKDLAEIAQMTPSYFSSIFKMLMRNTFTEYLNDIRIRKAMELLMEKDLSVTEIIFEVGYHNVAHFNRMFKKSTGITPTEYRKQAKLQSH